MKKLTSRRLPLAASLLSLSCSAFAQEMEEVIITSSLIDASAEAISNPLHVIERPIYCQRCKPEHWCQH